MPTPTIAPNNNPVQRNRHSRKKTHPACELYHGRTWGDWTLDAERLCLVFRGQPTKHDGTTAYLGEYEVDVERICRSSNLLDWIFQLNDKSWATARVMKDFLNAIDDIFCPQANLCSFGSDKRIEKPAEFLKARIEKILQ